MKLKDLLLRKISPSVLIIGVLEKTERICSKGGCLEEATALKNLNNALVYGTKQDLHFTQQSATPLNPSTQNMNTEADHDETSYRTKSNGGSPLSKDINKHYLNTNPILSPSNTSNTAGAGAGDAKYNEKYSRTNAQSNAGNESVGANPQNEASFSADSENAESYEQKRKNSILQMISLEWVQEINRLRFRNNYPNSPQNRVSCLRSGHAEIENSTKLIVIGNSLEVLTKSEYYPIIQKVDK